MRPACGVRTRIGRVRDVCCHTDYVRAVRQSVPMQAATHIAWRTYCCVFTIRVFASRLWYDDDYSTGPFGPKRFPGQSSCWWCTARTIFRMPSEIKRRGYRRRRRRLHVVVVGLVCTALERTGGGAMLLETCRLHWVSRQRTDSCTQRFIYEIACPTYNIQLNEWRH